MRNKFIYSCSIKILIRNHQNQIGFDELLESFFCLLVVVEAFSLQKVEMFEELVVNCQEVR